MTMHNAFANPHGYEMITMAAVATTKIRKILLFVLLCSTFIVHNDRTGTQPFGRERTVGQTFF